MKKLIVLSLIAVTSSMAVQAEELSKYQAETQAVVMPFLKQLGAANQQAIANGGHESAVGVCKEIAPQLAGDVSRQTGWKVSRVSLKVRNPLLGTPDAWEQKALQDFEARLAKGEKADGFVVSEVVEEPAGKFYRFMKAIPLQQGCVACHGTSEQISDGVKAKLKVEYPHDQATGYSVGQIRGAVSVKRPL
jgi:hypothetical protein